MPKIASGTISKLRLDKDVAGRGLCVQLNPQLPEGSGWACVWKDNPLCQETTTLLLNQYSGNKPCTINWNALRGTHIEIAVAEAP